LHRLLFIIVFALVLTPSASAMHWLSSGDITAEASSSGGANVSFAEPAGSTCSPAPNSLFAIGSTAVTCKDNTDPLITTDSFNVIVVDTTAPLFGPLSNVTDSTTGSSKAVSFSVAAPSDVNNVSNPVSVVCTPLSGSDFPIGTTSVSCSATDARSNAASAGFNVTVSDAGNPTISATAPAATEATGPGGAAVTYSVTASDNSGVAPSVDCGSHPSGSTFPVGSTSVTCTATDGAGNSASTSPFSVIVQDMTKPALTLPANIQVEADSASGKVVSYTASANDLVAGAVTPTCAPASGSSFPVGVTTVNCSAGDGHGNTANGSFTITVTDHAGPALSGFGNLTVEANGPAGSNVNWLPLAANDAVDGPIAPVSCSPASGTKFPIATTTVNCGATDSHGNTGNATFTVTVKDTTAPNLIVPAARSVYATTATGVPSTVSGIVAFLSAPSASDLVDPNPVITNDAPAFFPVGSNTVDFFAKDAAGNVTVKQSILVVLPEPPAGTPPLPIPTPPTIPTEVKNVKVTPLDGAVRIEWDAGGRTVEVIRSTSATRSLSAVGDERVVYTGTASSYVDRGLQNDVEVRYVVRAVNAAGNHSAGIAAVVIPRRDLLKSPKDGARLKKAPKLLWAIDAEAQYYNAQLMQNGVKILSAWPLRPAYTLKKTWKFNGRKYTLKPGLYTWFVWPGYGARSAVNYGKLMGTRTFRIIR
jgi:hypothetical protein